jgi:hypothetical protein
MMDWHIITSSKGGTGKTLLTLLLLAYHLERDKGTTLVIDLNGMNADTSAILLFQRNDHKLPVHLETDVVIPKEADTIVFEKSFSLDELKRPYDYYIVGRPLNPFGLYNSTLFADLLQTIKASAEQIANELKLEPIQQVIIDTNYHFCNLFAQEKTDKNYETYKTGTLKDESITIWFMWVYRQLEKLLHGDDATIINLTANAIEENLNSHWCQGNTTPFIHVFNPVALLSSHPDKDKKGYLTKTVSAFLEALAQRKDYTIDELIELEHFPRTACVPFDKWVEQLKIARVAMGDRFNDDPYFLILDILLQAINSLNGLNENERRPMNIIPLSVYHHALQCYTDKDRIDAISKLRKLRIFKCFSTLFDKV